MSTDHIAVAERALADCQARIALAEAQRVGQIAGDGDDYVTATTKIDRDVASLRAAAAAHRDRLVALRERERQAECGRQVERRKAGIAAIKKLLPARQAAAAKLDRAIAALREAYSELEIADRTVFTNWPPDVLPPAHRLSYLRMLNIESLSSMRKHRMSPGVVPALLEKPATLDLSAEAERRNAALIAELDESAAVSVAEQEAEAAA